jgi:hypothetical protein
MAARGLCVDTLHKEISTMELHYVLRKIQNAIDMLTGQYPKLDQKSTEEEVTELEAAKGKLRQVLYR